MTSPAQPKLDAQSVLAEAIASSKLLTGRYLAGFDDTSARAQPPGLPNHVVWSLGHCALTMHRVAHNLDGGTIPETDLGPAARNGSAFVVEEVAFGSSPQSAAGMPSLARAVDIFNAACDRLAEGCRRATHEQLTASVPWGNATTTTFLLIVRMLFHNGFHTGQIADIRRALAMKSVFA
jgi:hypothetical protein